jgi:hypothetical protein
LARAGVVFGVVVLASACSFGSGSHGPRALHLPSSAAQTCKLIDSSLMKLLGKQDAHGHLDEAFSNRPIAPGNSDGDRVYGPIPRTSVCAWRTADGVPATIDVMSWPTGSVRLAAFDKGSRAICGSAGPYDDEQRVFKVLKATTIGGLPAYECEKVTTMSGKDAHFKPYFFEVSTDQAFVLGRDGMILCRSDWFNHNLRIEPVSGIAHKMCEQAVARAENG